jgi:FMN phosphatase YigB (HAD superfamily)
MIKNISIFDLDGTIIDSSHRQMVKSDGTLDLAKWFEFATPEKIFEDTVLPLAQQVRKRQKRGDYVMVCTARNMTDADFEFLQNEGICPDKIISRPKGNMEPDGELKAKQLKSFLSLKQFQKASKIMFDDAASVRSSLRKIGIAVIHPEKIAERVA